MTGNKANILLIEDRPEDAELAIMTLRKNNLIHNIQWVQDGEEALEYVFAEGRYSHRNIEQMPSLIIMDLNIPKVSGIEVLRRIRSDERVKNIPVVILTASIEDKDIKAAYDLHVNSYMVKPVDFVEFEEAIKSMGLFWLSLNQRPY